MTDIQFEWDEDNEEHIARHNVDPEEAEEVVINDPLLNRTKDGKYLAYGHTDDGRYLLVVFVRKHGYLHRVVTARDLSENEMRAYRRKRQ